RIAGAEADDQAISEHAVQRLHLVGEHRVGEQRDPRDERTEHDPGGLDRERAEQDARLQRGVVGSGDGPEMVEDEHTVEAQLLRSARGRQRLFRVVAELRKRQSDAQASAAAPMAPARSPSSAGTMLMTGRRSAASTRSANATRVGSNRTSPASTSPPPITNISGSKTLARFASPSASHQANRPKTARAPASPSMAARVTCSPRTASGSSPASSRTRGTWPAWAASRARRPSPLPDA